MRKPITLLLLVFAAAPLWAQALSGPARVVDGDTLNLRGQTVHLHGIDAPEAEQQCRREDGTLWPCGAEAAAYLRRLVDDKPVVCQVRTRDADGRMLAACRAGGVDLNAALVEAGLALAYRQDSVDYVDAEESARAAQRGMWRGEFLAPWEWQRGFRLQGEGRAAAARAPAPAAAPSAAPAARCRIKGNIGSGGTRIYHVPGSRLYERTRIDESQGERWFCTEDEARAAGWRPPRSR